ncbi:MAG: TIGR00725 family protein [Archangium sp.]|nr:TIGR00725 family protein [Archangium sp.]MDP3575341.1 TIGR00725 family protein [Archangium sp.]
MLSEAVKRLPVVSVIGDARLEDQTEITQTRELGAALIDAGFRIITGGLGGVMEEVSRGARSSSAWCDGRIIGIVPSYRASDANPWCDVVIPSGMQMGRNVLVVSSADVVLAIGGGAGTLSEIAIAWQLGRPIVAFGRRGWGGRLAGEVIDARSTEPIHTASDVADAVRRCRELAARPATAGDIGAGWRHGR